jgi:hypothetical protein
MSYPSALEKSIRSERALKLAVAELYVRGVSSHDVAAINDAIRNGASMHEVMGFAGDADIRTTEVYFVRSAQRKRAC